MLKIADIFGEHMVLQRQKEICIWGTSNPNTKISCVFTGVDEEFVSVISDDKGEWQIFLKSKEAQRDVTLTIYDEIDKIIFTDVCIGEVWIAGGQSNMEFYLQFDEDFNTSPQKNNDADIRFFDTPKICYEGQEDEYDYSNFGFWRTCIKEDLPYYTAVGYYFSKEIFEHLDIPVGIIGCNFGGTPACAWLDESILKGSEGEIWLKDYKEQTDGLDINKYTELFKKYWDSDRLDPLGVQLQSAWGKVMYPGLSREEQLKYLEEKKEEDLPLGPLSENRPGGLYKTMVTKIAPYTMRGVIWYQGESDSRYPMVYSSVLRILIQSWRKLWNDNIPFLMVQLAPFDKWLHCSGDNFHLIRDEQIKVSETIDDVWLCSSSDLGMKWDIHPKIKKPIGIRLSLLARKYIYGEDILCESSKFENAKRIAEGIEINIKNADGLFCKEEFIKEFIFKDDYENIIIPKNIRITKNKLLIEGEFSGNTHIYFAQTSYYQVNIYNKAGLPMMPFKCVI